MKLHTLEFTAMGPFADTQRIDFQRLGSSGLFLFEGPTGSGKTTILDVITFALYGAGSKFGPDQARLHSHFAQEVSPSATLEFSVDGERYKITRSPEHERPSKRGAGKTVKAAAQATLWKRVGDGWSDLATQSKEVGILVTEIVGLTGEQFSRVILLPQGQFSKFLTSTNDEREKILSQLFRTTSYSDIASWFQNHASACKGARDQAQNTLDQAIAAAASAGKAGADLLEIWHKEDPSSLGATLGNYTDLLAGRLESAAAAAAVAAKELEEAQAAETLSAAIHKAAGQLAAARQAKADHAKGELAHDADVLKLKRAKAAGALRTQITELRSSRTQLGQRRKAVEAKRQAVEGIDSDASPTLISKEATDRFATARSIERLVEAEKALGANRAALTSTRADLERKRDELVMLEEELVQLPARRDAASESHRQAELAAAGLDALQDEQMRLSEISKAVDEVARLEIEERDLMAVALEAKKVWLDAREVETDLLDRRAKQSASILAAELKDGDPCRVCGSTVHPNPAPPVEDAVTDREIKEAKAKVALAEERHARADKEFNECMAALSAAGSARGAHTADSVADGLAEVSTKLAAGRTAKAGLPTLAQAVKELDGRISTLNDKVGALKGDLAGLGEKCTALAEAVSLAEAEVEGARAGFPTVQARIEALDGESTLLTELAEATTELVSLSAEVEKAETSLGKQSVEHGFADLAEAEESMLTPDEIAGLDRRNTAYETEGTRVALSVDAASEALVRLLEQRARAIGSDSEVPDIATVDLDGFRSEMNLAREGAKRAQAMQEAAISALTIAEDAHEHFTVRAAAAVTAAESFRRAEEEWQPLEQLRLLCDGKAGNNARMSLVSYVLRTWFEAVVVAANLRLQRIAGGKYELRRTDGGSRATDRTGLGLEVLDRYTGLTRPASSLSGGETFYTSVALALGLADVVQSEAGGASLDTLFIDEGFGTLDSDLLDQIMEVLTDLQGDGRVVGIVSHVDALKDQISEQLVVRREREDGPSTLKVRA